MLVHSLACDNGDFKKHLILKISIENILFFQKKTVKMSFATCYFCRGCFESQKKTNAYFFLICSVWPCLPKKISDDFLLFASPGCGVAQKMSDNLLLLFLPLGFARYLSGRQNSRECSDSTNVPGPEQYFLPEINV